MIKNTFFKITKDGINQGFQEFESAHDAENFLKSWAWEMADAGEITDIDDFVDQFKIAEF